MLIKITDGITIISAKYVQSYPANFICNADETARILLEENAFRNFPCS